MKNERRVVITGIGAVSPIGNTVEAFWDSIRNSRSGGCRITKFDASEYPTRIAAEVKDFDPSVAMEKKEARKMDIFSQYVVVAGDEAMKKAELTKGNLDPERFGVILGCGIGGLSSLEDSYENLFLKGPRRVHPMTIPKMIPNIAPSNLAIHFNAQGPCFNVATACSSATDAIGTAAQYIKAGISDVIISGGVEAAITKIGVIGFSVIQALSTRNDDPESASRPFDKDRDGFLIGEGSGILILEELEHAKRRGAPILAELAGYGISCDANHLTAPHPEGRGAIAAMKMALADAGIEPHEVDYINAHGTSTPINDPTETLVIKKVFGDHAYQLKVSSTKSMTGHCIGAAGGIEAIACILAIRDQFFPPTIHLDEPAPECDLDYVPNTGVEGKIDITLSDSLGFGGHNGVVIIKKYSD
jgi:3-oxoacyl-[acyl-carrier-protein] synthase II